MKKIQIYILAIFALGNILFLNSCSKEESPVAPSGLTVAPLSGGVGTLLTIQGAGLGKVQKVLFGKQQASFNPVYNTDGALLIRVPVGAEAGKQTITIYNAGGDATVGTLEFEVTRPKPILTDVQPRTRVGNGELITILGDNFTGLNYPEPSVTVGGVKCDIVSKEATKLTVRVTTAKTGPLEVFLGSESSKTAYDLEAETIVHLIANFNCQSCKTNGSTDASYWYTYGDVDGAFKVATESPAPLDGGFMKMTNAKGTFKDGYSGSGHDDAIKYDLSKVVPESGLKFDVNSNGVKTTRMYVAIRLKNGGGEWIKRYDVNWDGWKSVTVNLKDAEKWYGQGAGVNALNPKDITMVYFGFDNYKDKPQDLNIDNVRFIK
jgi:hypothetical protein